jgi:protein required for attachment to host cells
MNAAFKTCWVLVADSGRARIMQLERRPASISELKAMDAAGRGSRSHELVSDSGGRSFNTSGPASHTKLRRSDPHNLAEEKFIRAVVDYLENAARAGSFKNLLVVADPKTLGRLRGQLNDQLAGTIAAESNLDLVRVPLRDLEPRLRKMLGWLV